MNQSLQLEYSTNITYCKHHAVAAMQPFKKCHFCSNLISFEVHCLYFCTAFCSTTTVDDLPASAFKASNVIQTSSSEHTSLCNEETTLSGRL